MQTEINHLLDRDPHARDVRRGATEDETVPARLTRCRSTSPAEARRKYETVVLLDESPNPDLIPSALTN